MKTWKICVCVMSVMFFILAVTACQQSGDAKSSELLGAIEKEDSGNGFLIKTEGKAYHIQSQQDLSSMVGKMVMLKGTISNKDGEFTILVDEVKKM